MVEFDNNNKTLERFTGLFSNPIAIGNLTHAVTVHNSQDITLNRVVINLTDDRIEQSQLSKLIQDQNDF